MEVTKKRVGITMKRVGITSNRVFVNPMRCEVNSNSNVVIKTLIEVKIDKSAPVWHSIFVIPILLGFAY